VKHLEKIVFIVVLILVGGLSAWVLMGGSETSSITGKVQPLQGGTTLVEYEGLPAFPDVIWPEPQAQDSAGKWLYRVFTPPKLFIVDGRFDPEPPPLPGQEIIIEVVEEEPFGVRLVKMERQKYRLQLDAVYEVELDNVDTAVLSFENVYATQTEMPTISLKKGQTHPVHNFRVDDIRKIERDVGGGLETEHIATITDLDNGKVYLLSDNDTMYEEGITVVFAAIDNPEQTVSLNSVGETFEMNEATYTLSEINMDEESVELIKEAPDMEMPKKEILTPTSAIPPTPSPSTSRPVTPTDSKTSDFGDLFN